jgi:hypothetical protein
MSCFVSGEMGESDEMDRNNSENYREKARSLRALTLQMHHWESKAALLRLADAFDQLAERVAARAMSEADA